MPMQANEIKDLILETFPDAKIKIDDLRGDGCLLYTSQSPRD